MKKIIAGIFICIIAIVVIVASGGGRMLGRYESGAGGRIAGIVVRGKPVRQPVEYNHSLHIENEMVCVDCHKYVETQARATIPNIETCAECHDPEEPLIDPEIAETDEERKIAEGKALREKKLLEYIEKDEQIPWAKVYRVPDFVCFSHQRHVTLGKLDCIECHSDMTKQVKPLSKELIPIKMKRCIACHKEKQVNHDCATCHR